MFKNNEYFDGKVKSIAFQGQDKPATVGVMAAGEYLFNTAEKEKSTENAKFYADKKQEYEKLQESLHLDKQRSDIDE